ncbi:hypothetical protein C3F09_09695 [candidate division GN15 bacterium]|uniref:Prephenate/arogenate dehydrogenase domain-containing protein n=1 Tax=candidate division GN15 bacterium TaxID=2072418 RepID=A0A855X3L5_9BACT|nr:MAG: hypothetical protein C3F09_09695 [candidate division GN15 bacterium]
MMLAGKIIGIIGCGQMGGSMAATLTRLLPAVTIVGYDRKRPLLKAALRQRTVNDTAVSVSDLIDRADIVIVATPISAIIDILTEESGRLAEKLLVVDLGSIRHPIQTAALPVGLTNHIGMHFLCGTNLRGVASWNDSLFHGAQCLLFTPNVRDERALLLARQLVKVLKARPTFLDPQTHDDLFAVTSGLPHLLAFSLLKLWNDSGRPDLRGPSFDSATRVASSDPTMVSEMLFHNRRSILIAMSHLETNLKRFRATLERVDPAILQRYLKNCNGRRTARVSNGKDERSKSSSPFLRGLFIP